MWRLGARGSFDRDRGFSVPDAFGTNLHFLVSNRAGASAGVTP